MPTHGQNVETLRRPEIFLAELLRKAARGHLLDVERNVPVLYRAAVVAVDPVGGRLENPEGGGSVRGIDSGRPREFVATVGPANPPNSVRARVIVGGFDQFLGSDDLRTFWPIFPNDHISVPIKPGEHVYAIFEDRDFEHGLWLCRVSGHVGANVVLGASRFSGPDTDAMAAFGDVPARDPGYPLTDEYAGDAPPSRSAISLFEGG